MRDTGTGSVDTMSCRTRDARRVCRRGLVSGGTGDRRRRPPALPQPAGTVLDQKEEASDFEDCVFIGAHTWPAWGRGVWASNGAGTRQGSLQAPRPLRWWELRTRLLVAVVGGAGTWILPGGPLPPSLPAKDLAAGRTP